MKRTERQKAKEQPYKYFVKDSTNKDDCNKLKHGQHTHNRLVNDTVERFKKRNMMREKNSYGLKTENLKTPKFYLQPKIHKNGNPGRMVVQLITGE